MINREDRFGNPIEVGDIIAYYGKTIGLIVGVVVGLNPLSYKVKTKKGTNGGRETYKYHNIPFSFRDVILTSKGMNSVNALDILDEVEKLRLDLV